MVSPGRVENPGLQRAVERAWPQPPGSLFGHPLDQTHDHLLDVLDVGRERAQDLFMGDGRLVAWDSVVVVGDQRDVDVAHLQFTGQDGLGVAGHVDDFPALGLEPAALGPRRKARSLDDHHGACGVDLDAQIPADL